MSSLRTVVYVDGFNLYYRCLKGTGHRWLDLVALCRRVLSPINQVVAVKYYTAMVDAWPGDLDQPVRQATYLRALRTRKEVSIHLGHYLTKPTRLPLAKPVRGLPRIVEVLRAEEKGSDVNLAAHLVRDGFRGDFDAAVVISNDSDLYEPIRIVTQELAKPVGLLIPEGTNVSAKLRPVASFLRPIRRSALAASQFAEELSDRVGVFRKPERW
jgi:uncharacterized LabA/DUF88 family protein